jgi:hypothetical protein
VFISPAGAFFVWMVKDGWGWEKTAKNGFE